MSDSPADLASMPVTHAPVPPAVAASVAGSNRRSNNGILVLLVLVVLVLGGGMVWQWWTGAQREAELRQEVAARLQSSDVRTDQIARALESLSETVRHLSNTTNLLNSRQQEARASQQALQQLYQDFSRTGDDWMLTEAERILALGSQQLQLTSNVRGALLAVDSADKTLAASSNPRFLAIRRALEEDRQRLKALPLVDVTGMAVRIDSLLASVDTLPLLADLAEIPGLHRTVVRAQASPAPVFPIAQGAPVKAYFDYWWQRSRQWIAGAWQAVWPEISALVTVRRADRPDVMSLSPSQTFFIRENLKLRLLNARLGLLAHDDATYRTDLQASRDLLKQYFDQRAPRVTAMGSSLDELQGVALSIRLPALNSLSEIQILKGKS